MRREIATQTRRGAAPRRCARALAAALATALVLTVLPAAAATLTVHGWEAGERVDYTLRGSDASARAHLLHTELDGVAGRSFCIDLDHYISTGSYEAMVHDPAAAAAALGDGRSFAGAASLADRYAFDVGGLSDALGVGRAAALTGVQVGIWEAVYGEDFAVRGISSQARATWEALSSGEGWGRTVIVDFARAQDQTFTPVVPEPGAALLFGAGALAAGARIRRRGRG